MKKRKSGGEISWFLPMACSTLMITQREGMEKHLVISFGAMGRDDWPGVLEPFRKVRNHIKLSDFGLRIMNCFFLFHTRSWFK